MKKFFLISLSLFSTTLYAADYKTALTGKILSMKGSNCAGLSLSKNSGLMGDQSPCTVDLPTRIRWISNDTFMMVEKNQISSDKPPRVFLYKVKSLQGNKVVLSDIWTGWNSFPDSDTTYLIK
jgi:hypothetical protein